MKARVYQALFSLALALTTLLGFEQARAQTFSLPPADVDLIGSIHTASVKKDDTLLDVARRFGIGQEEIVLANPDVDRWLPRVDAEVVIPARYILPRAERNGIVLNVPEMRLYYYPPPKAGESAAVKTYAVSIGRMDWATPLGLTKVLSKTEDPSWTPPQSIREEAEADGKPLPEVVPAGPDNPLGKYALRLERAGYLIHGTNKPFGVGMRVTHGCVRMYPEDIALFYPEVPVGTRVQIVDQPVKIGWHLNTLFIEIHPPLEEKQEEPEKMLETVMELLHTVWEQHPLDLDSAALKEALDKQDGIPRAIARSKLD